ncbi:hypothetical protein KKC59_01005 [bacterium]|nr:hypothetical protein [bacterium]
MRSELKKTKRLVIKIGTNILCKNGQIDYKYIQSLARQIFTLKKSRKIDVIIVSSGAVGLGIQTLGLKELPKTLPEKQAAASIGQSRLMHMYNREFDKRKLVTSQILITQ